MSDDKIRRMYRLVARRVLQQAWVDACDETRAAELLLWMKTREFALWCDVAEEPDDEVSERIRYRIYHDENGSPRELLPMQRYILDPRFRQAFYPGASFVEALADYQSWRADNGLPPEKVYVHTYTPVFKQHGLSVVGGGARAKVMKVDEDFS